MTLAQIGLLYVCIGIFTAVWLHMKIGNDYRYQLNRYTREAKLVVSILGGAIWPATLVIFIMERTNA